MAPEKKAKPNPRKALLKPVTAVAGYNPTNGVRFVPGQNQQQQPTVASPVGSGRKAPGTEKVTTKLYGAVPKGRPVSNIGQYLLKPTPESPTGVEMLNTEADLIGQVQKRYLTAFQLPPALQPKYLRKPEVLDTQRGRNISRGWRNPRSLSKP
jgi:hypothetical protein